MAVREALAALACGASMWHVARRCRRVRRATAPPTIPLSSLNSSVETSYRNQPASIVRLRVRICVSYLSARGQLQIGFPVSNLFLLVSRLNQWQFYRALSAAEAPWRRTLGTLLALHAVPSSVQESDDQRTPQQMDPRK
jgi:hypothetical protein